MDITNVNIVEEYYVIQYQSFQIKNWYDTEFSQLETIDNANIKLRYCIENTLRGFRFRIVLRKLVEEVVG